MNLRILFLSLFVFLNTTSFSSAFDIQNFIKSSLEKTAPMYVKEVAISQHIQLFDLLSKHLQVETSKEKAVPIALALISFGATPYRTGLPQPSNEQERNILTQALYSAVRYLRQQDALSEEGVVAFIESKTKIFQDASQQDYVAYLSSVLLSAYRDHFGAYSFVENKQILTAPLAGTWLKERLAQDSYWQYLDAYWVQNRSGTSTAAGLEKPKSVGIIPGLAKSLSETADLNEASTYANDLFNILRTQSDFSLLISASCDQAAQAASLIPAHGDCTDISSA
ncbi:hypothetical protein [Candidatus Finniella inopinata]|uniref:Uncharacterized protein n=1 Tax=Candidatus Finniella inopinata TaxID=1696036 RepID=A0A4Q7DGE6_9PROT|nr:hypothetical protein [Candidatus Finniella inopinata]RZI45258.1 hypothetical protein EQU50_07650 [Candidatus Finniella inopinata]